MRGPCIRGSVVAAIAVAGVIGMLAGCGLARNGLLADGEPDDADAGSRLAHDAAAPTGDDDGSRLRIDGAVDAGGDDGARAEDDANDGSRLAIDAACPAPATDASVAAAMAAATPPTIDGELSDWGCGPWTALNDTNAAYVREDGQKISGIYAVRWDATSLYVAAQITVPTLQGDDTVNPYDNDAFEIYVSGDAPLTGDYDALSHQYIVDWHDLAVDYGPVHYPPAMSSSSPPHFTSMVKVVPGGWQAEVAIGWQAIQKMGPGLATGTVLGFDVQLDDGNGAAINTQILATFAPHAAACGCATCCCGQATDYPSCDTLCFGSLTLK